MGIYLGECQRCTSPLIHGLCFLTLPSDWKVASSLGYADTFIKHAHIKANPTITSNQRTVHRRNIPPENMFSLRLGSEDIIVLSHHL